MMDFISIKGNKDIDDFYLMDFVVEQADWIKTLSSNPSFFKGDDLPVECITWYDAIDFCNKRSSDEGLRECYEIVNGYITCNFEVNGYRLPTEAEWDYAAKGGENRKNYIYSGSNIIDEVAWYANNSNRRTHPKGQKKPNELGLFDMTGNVFEWCWDWYNKYPDFYNNPKGPDKGNKKIVRGNCWINGSSVMHLDRRVARAPSTSNHHLGLRLVKSIIRKKES